MSYKDVKGSLVDSALLHYFSTLYFSLKVGGKSDS